MAQSTDQQGNDQGTGSSRRSIPVGMATGLIHGYQRFISPALGPRCRFHPSCSEYAGQAIREFGLIRGSWLAIRRLARCHPFSSGGADPLPARFRWWGRGKNNPG